MRETKGRQRAGKTLDILQTIFELIDMRSFSNLWYWIALAVTWSTASHYVLGVPFDMIVRARRRGGPVAEDMLMLTAVNVRRLLSISREAGVMLTLVASFLISLIVVLGFVFRIEFAQAVALILVPLSGVGLLSLRTAARLEPVLADAPEVERVARILLRHRVSVQAIGMGSICVTALWGMFQNLQLSPLG
ncbi:component of SufBCD complex [Rhodobacter capsulatus]|nr:component of SufBCD complex [Rhodobacter capsulatus]MDS0927266.1 component of SufBCD complex [Rhodobacter capsulatus]